MKNRVSGSQRDMRCYGLVGLLPVLVLLVLAACHDSTPGAWPWWTDKDRAAVTSELNTWRDSTTTRFFVEGGVEALTDSVGLIARDSTSPTGDSMIKVRRLSGFGLMPADMTTRDSLLFGVTDDSVTNDTAFGDTFCQVTAIDSAASSYGLTSIRDYWVVKYHPESTVTPAETTVVYKLDSLAPPPRLVAESTQMQKVVPLQTWRYLYLRKHGADYHLRRMTGFSLYLPSTIDAPSLKWLSLGYRGAVDTFKLYAQANHLGIYNLLDCDSLYTVKRGESLALFISNDAPTLAGDQYYFLARINGRRILLDKGTVMGATRNVAFDQVGLNHLVLEVIPQSNLLYPGRDFAVAIWSLPIRVTE